MALYWFHALDRDTPEALLDALRLGPAPAPPEVQSNTRDLETVLEIAPPRVYCYLGRTIEAFGNYAFAFEDEDLPATDVSPFDTGGLVNYVKPVCRWVLGERRAYLRSYTFSTDRLKALLDEYPGRGTSDMTQYLASNRPSQAGPHEIWAGLFQEPVEIWRENDDWRCWTWEARWAGRVPVRERLVAWSCPPAEFNRLVEYQPRDEEVANWFYAFLRKYVHGGVAQLVTELRARQENAA